MRIVFFFFLLISFSVRSQIDTLFWFAAPEVTSLHADRPIRLVISSFSSQSEVRIDMPSNTAFTPIDIVLQPNSSKIVDLTSQIDLIENGSYNTVKQSGLKIQSTNLISAYYEVLGAQLLHWLPGQQYGVTNADIFTLKGANALGLEFYLPFQTKYNNATSGLNGTAWAAAEILATEDNTTIEVFPTQKFFGHPSNFTIHLNKGEVYTIRSESALGALKPIATYVSSNKPIAITINDDSVLHPDGGWDLIGDQLIPVRKLGYQYILEGGDAFLIATEDNTLVTVSSNSGERPFRKGEYVNWNIEDQYSFKSTKPILVYQTKSLGGELGAAILPPVNCTGSNSIRFTRSTNHPFFLDLIAKKGSENDFIINGVSGLVSSADFKAVTNTDGKWLFATIDFSDESVIKTGKATSIINETSPFHAGITNGKSSTGYGFFSNFGSFELGEDIDVCGNEQVILSGGLGRDVYNWSFNGDLISNEETIEITESGSYKLNAMEGVNCEIKDSIKITFHNIPKITFLNYEEKFCEGDSVKIKVTPNFSNYQWGNFNSTDSSFFVKKGGDIKVVVTDSNSCTTDRTASITMIKFPEVELGEDIKVCGSRSVKLKVPSNIGSILWSTGSTQNFIEVSQTGKYSIKAVNDGLCRVDDTVQVAFYPIPKVSLSYESTRFCDGSSLKLKATEGYDNYLWNSSNSTDSFLTIKEGGKYSVTVTDSNSCKKRSSEIAISKIPLPEVDLGEEVQMLCAGAPKTFSLDPRFNYLWNDGTSIFRKTIGNAGEYSVKVFNECDTISDRVVFEVWDIDYPNIITPNGDGKNEAFVISGISNGVWSLTVSNRHGKEVYKNNDYKNDYIPEELSDGIYYFILSEGDQCNTFAGWIQVVR